MRVKCELSGYVVAGTELLSRCLTAKPSVVSDGGSGAGEAGGSGIGGAGGAGGPGGGIGISGIESGIIGEYLV